MTRISYKKADTHGNWLFSQKILCGSKLVVISLDLENLVYHIEQGTQCIRSGNANTLASLKKKAKNASIELGAVFDDEVRNRGTVERFEV